jgi:putative chitinase
MSGLVDLQRELGLKPDGIFGRNTLRAATKYFNLSNESSAHFFGQLSHETNNFKFFVENLNYSKDGLLRVFKKYFTPEQAEAYQRKPEMIANRVYANRIGNGDERSGDGWRFRGRGAIQLTGRANYLEFSKWVGDSEIISNPNLVATTYAFDSAIFFFDQRKIWSVINGRVDDATILRVTKIINGGTNGLAHRKELTYQYYRWLSDK